jgi:phage terminase large subunit-like protein
MDWDLACPDWWERLQAGRLPVRDDLPLHLPLADRAAAIFRRLRLSDVPGTPTAAEAGGEWFAQTLRANFGSVDPETRARYLREQFWLVPKKNAKTTFGALGMVTALLLNERPRATFLMTAPVQDTANLAYEAAAGAIDLDPVLSKKFHPRHHLKTIIHRETKAQLEIMTFDPAVLTGVKVSGGALLDELHECAKKAKASQALRQIRGGMLPFPEAFLWFITTQSDSPPTGVFADELQKARDIRDGKRRGRMLPILFEFPREVQESVDKKWKDPALWPLLNPNLGRAITLSDMREQFQDALDKNEGELRSWASQHLNIQIGMALHAAAWVGAEFWEQNADETLTLDSLLDRSEVAVVGVDGGGLDDLLGLTVVGRERGTRKRLVWSHAWAHKIVLDRRKEIEPKLRDLEKAGDLTIVDLPGSDVQEVADIIVRVRERGLLPELHGIGVDAVGIDAIVEELTSPERKFSKDEIVGVSQGWRLSGAIKQTERDLAGGEIVHAGQPLMSWAVANAKVVLAGNATTITKAASGTAKIDPLMALFDAMTLMALNPAPRKKKLVLMALG